MAIEVFGFSFGKKKEQEEKNLESTQIPVTPEPYDGTYTFETGGVFGTSIDFSGAIKDENQLINQYRGIHCTRWLIGQGCQNPIIDHVD